MQAGGGGPRLEEDRREDQGTPSETNTRAGLGHMDTRIQLHTGTQTHARAHTHTHTKTHRDLETDTQGHTETYENMEQRLRGTDTDRQTQSLVSHRDRALCGLGPALAGVRCPEHCPSARLPGLVSQSGRAPAQPAPSRSEPHKQAGCLTVQGAPGPPVCQAHHEHKLVHPHYP